MGADQGATNRLRGLIKQTTARQVHIEPVDAGYAEVTYFKFVRTHQQDVFRTQVGMDHMMLMGILQATHYLFET